MKGLVSCLAAVIGVLCFAVAACAATPPLESQFDATCRLTAPGGSMGTGSVIQANTQYVAVLTNYHVLRDDRTQTVASVTAAEFWSQGHLSAKLPGQTLCSDANLDAAIVLIPTAAFEGRVPKPIPLATSTPSSGALIRSVGCSNGTWATGFQGHITGADEMQFYFVPPPANGRSGSAVTNERGELVGLLRVRVGKEGAANQEGGAVRIEALLPRLQGIAHTASLTWKPDQQLAAWVGCGPDGCTPPAQEDMFGRKPNLFPGLWQQRQAPTPQPSQAWPTAPQVIQAPGTDLSPVISAINGLQDTLRQQSPALPASPQTCGPDPATVQALQSLSNQGQQHTAAIETLGKNQTALADGQAKISEKVEAVGKTANETREIIEKNGTLRERFALAKEQAKENDPEAGRLKLDVEAAKSMLGTHHTVFITLAIVAGLIGIAGGIHWLRTGHGLVATALEKAAARHPENERLVAFSAKLDAHEEALRAKLPGAPIMGLHPAAVAGLVATGNVPAAVGLSAVDVMNLVKQHVDARLAPAPGATPAAPATAAAAVQA